MNYWEWYFKNRKIKKYKKRKIKIAELKKELKEQKKLLETQSKCQHIYNLSIEYRNVGTGTQTIHRAICKKCLKENIW